MNKLIEFFSRKGIFGDLVTIFVILLGIGSMFLIRREVFPNVTFDVITITTIYPGATAEEAEKLITNPLEQDLKEVDGIKKLNSISVANRSYIAAQLDIDTTTEAEGKDDIQDVVDRFTDLPKGAEDPVVTSIESKLNPVIEVTLGGDMPPLKLREIAKQIENELESVNGVARIAPRGMRDLEIRVEADAQKLSGYRLSIDDIVKALGGQNVSIPGGVLPVDSKDAKSLERSVRTIGEFETPEEVGETVIRANDIGNSIKVKDVAKVYLDLEEPEIYNHVNGKKSISLTVLKKEKADAITVVDKVRARMAELTPGLNEKGIEVDYVNDLSEFIRRRLSVLSGNLYIGLFLVLLILSFILPFRVALLVSLGIPFSFLGAMIYFNVAGYTINLISMLGLIIVSGMLVDDAIVVTDNAVRLMEEGMEPEDAAVKSAQEIWPAVTASVLTTVIAFVPMLYMSGIFGKFVKQIPLGVIIPLFVSLIEAFFILPAHIARWVRVDKRYDAKHKGKLNPISALLGKSEELWDKVAVPKYVASMKWILKNRYIVAASTVGLFVVSIGLATQKMKFILFPPDGVEIFFVRTQSAVGTSLEQTEAMIKPIEERLLKLPKEELKNFVTTIGIQQQDPWDPNTKRGAEYAQIAVYLTPETERTRKAFEIIEDLRATTPKPDGVQRLVFERVNPGPPVGKAVDLGVRGETYEEITKAVEELKTRLAEIKGVTDILDSFSPGREEFIVKVNPSEAAAANLGVAQVGTTIRGAFEGIVATQIRGLSEETDVRVSLPDSQKSSQRVLEDLLVPNPMGSLVPLKEIATITKDRGVAGYEHAERRRQVRVTAEVDQNVTSSIAVNNQVEKILPEIMKNHPRISVAFGGEDEDTKESMASLARSMLVAVMGIFLVLVLTFGQILQPLLVLVTVPLGIIAVILTLFLHGLPLSFMAMLGIVALAGVIVNNAIVFVDFVNQRRATGLNRWESITSAAQVRIRPIFLTTLTTVAGLLPTAYGIGGLDKFVVPIAMSLGWGLMIGSFLTAFVFPAAVAILDDLNLFLGKFFPAFRDPSLKG